MSTHDARVFDPDRVTHFAETNHRGSRVPFGIRLADRFSHVHLIGKTGTGKSTLLDTFMRADMEHGHGFALLDPHGDLAERVIAALPAHRRDDLIDFAPADRASPWGFNPLARPEPGRRMLAAAGLLDAFKKIWGESWGPRLEHILRNAFLLLLDQPRATLADVPRLWEEPAFRRSAAENARDPMVARFWLREFENYPDRLRAEAIAPLQNKVGAFLSNPILRRALCEPEREFSPRRVMDEGRVLVVRLDKGRMGAETASLLGSLLVSQMSVAAMSRADRPESDRRPFFLYLDEFHSFSTPALAEMLSELRKYRVGLVLAHQYLEQLEETVRGAILGNVGTNVVFRIGATDAEVFAKEFGGEIDEADFTNLPNRAIYLRLMIEGRASRAFSAET